MNRRAVVQGILAAAAAVVNTRLARTQEVESNLPLPRRETFESGDFIWPKKPGAYVPYNSGTEDSVNHDEQRWLREREAFVERVQRDPTYFTPQDIEKIRQLTYREFYARYAGDQTPGVPGNYSTGGGIYVGHVGILEIDDNNEAWVVEALGGQGVVRSKYDQWIKSRPDEIVWHGRVRDLEKAARAKIVDEAKKFLGRPYNFWNFDLNDDAGFYCSKLAWLAIWRSQSFAIDGNSNPHRTFWFSPKQLLYAKTIARLHDPGPYANR